MCRELYGITVDKPEGFQFLEGKDIPDYYSSLVNAEKGAAWQYAFVFASEGQDCLMCYPYINYWGKNVSHRMFKEVKYALGLVSKEDKSARDTVQYLNSSTAPKDYIAPFDTARYIKKIHLDDMSGYCHADTVTIYRTKLREVSPGGYTMGVGITLKKKGHPYGLMKIFLTEAGLQREEEYIRMLLDCFRYPNELPQPDEAIIESLKSRIEPRSPLQLMIPLNEEMRPKE